MSDRGPMDVGGCDLNPGSFPPEWFFSHPESIVTSLPAKGSDSLPDHFVTLQKRKKFIAKV